MSQEVETINIHDTFHKTGSTDFHLWQDEAGWWSCRSGEYRGINSESDDLGPFESQALALESQHDDFDAAQESSQNDQLFL